MWKAWQSFLDWLRSLFFKQEMELALVGLQNAGKTSFVNVVATGSFNEDMIPTVGFNMRKVSKGKVSIKLWDLGGQPRFRSMWERYCRGVNAVVYVVDAADHAGANMAKSELHELLNKPTLAGIPLLVLGNKNDLPGAMTMTSVACVNTFATVPVKGPLSWVMEIIDRLELKSVQGREVCCYCISCKNAVNIDICLEWLTKHAKKPGM